ncbi:(2Fe-2S)-binding protein [Mitsuaria sp. 7]|uniref:(2Fe-2S)-binding protein n=1 Tax=Mitsuaria sp. 7 TaxID=1658665 RepID=UPI0008350375|nr:(2Fe-2S)-binding protein [Mitsuaria sp. 7]
MVPSLHGRCDADAAAQSADVAAEGLVAALRARDPQAGRAYWALRAWSRLVWQPTYASVFAVELAGGVLPLAGLGWDVDIDEADVTGFAIPAASFAATTSGSGRARAAEQLRTLSATLLVAVQANLPLHPKAARRQLADCVLAALLRVQPLTRQTDDDLHDIGADWLRLLGASGDSGYLAFDTAPGTTCLALDRGVCCLDDRRAGGDMCNTCPRLPRAERLRRLGAQDLRNSA